MSTWLQLGLQDAYSPVIEEFIFFHDFAIVVLTAIIRFVGYIIALLGKNSLVDKTLLERQIIEWIWTIVPAIILIQLAIPSLVLLYTLEETIECSLSLKAIGHQWYWSYEYSDFKTKKGEGLNFDSYIITDSSNDVIRLLDTDNRVTLPYSLPIQVIVTSADVLHSWTVPVLGVKADACPGRLNNVIFLSHRPGLRYGQCSEICGANHRFIPIALEMVTQRDFLQWLTTALLDE